MIKFITNRKHNVQEIAEKLEIRNTLTQEDVNYLLSQQVLGYDLETTGLCPFADSILLVIIGTKEVQYVIDINNNFSTLFRVVEILNKLNSRIIWLGSNLKFDYQFTKTKLNISLEKLHDVMIAEQRISQGMGISFGKPIKGYYRLDTIVERRLGFIPPTMNKQIREEFVGSNPDTFLFDNRHIEYAAGDIAYLFDVKVIEEERIKQLKMELLIYDIEFPLIKVLADCELEGVKIDEDKWRANIKANKGKKFEFQCKLDEELRTLRDKICLPVNRKYLVGGKWDRTRLEKKVLVQTNLFDEVVVTTESIKKDKKDSDAYVNYSSTDVLVNIFGRLSQPLPTKGQVLVVPQFTKVTLKNGVVKEKIDKSIHKFTTGEGAIESYLIENPTTPIKTFIKHLIDYRMYTTRINNFGAGFLNKFKNKVTGRFHTVYRQCSAVNGRLQSGDKDNGRFNSQNQIAEKEHRECFIADEDYLMCTTDLSGAEAVIMIDKARDEKFYQIAIVNDDAHSPLAEKVWRNIGQHRVNNGLFNIVNHDKTPQELANITISKKENKDIRTLFKNTTFASIYGCHYKKYSKMLNISHDEGKIGLATMKRELPKTFKMVENNAKFALTNGFLTLNTRTNSRICYPEVIQAIKNQSEIEWSIAHDVEGNARNAAISGTQADMVKEMMVEIAKDIKLNNWDAKLVFQVHDELVYKFHKSLIDIFPAYVKDKMCEVANRYLSFIKMSAEQHIETSWTK